MTITVKSSVRSAKSVSHLIQPERMETGNTTQLVLRANRIVTVADKSMAKARGFTRSLTA